MTARFRKEKLTKVLEAAAAAGQSVSHVKFPDGMEVTFANGEAVVTGGPTSEAKALEAMMNAGMGGKRIRKASGR